MLERCDFRTFHECSCGPNQCRVQNIGRFAKSEKRTLGTVLAKSRAGWATTYFISLAIAFLCIGTAGFMLCNALVDLDRQIMIAERV